MRNVTAQKARKLIKLAILIAALVLAERLIWPRYSRERYIDPDDVRLAAIPAYGCPEPCEVHRDREPRLLKRLIAALNRGRSGPRYKLALGQEIFIHRWRKPSILIRFDDLREDGPLVFRDESSDRSGGLYRSRALRRVLEAIYHSKQCQVKPPRVPPQSFSRVVLYAGDSQHTVPGSSPQACPLLSFVNGNLQSVDTSFYHIPRDDTLRRSFYLGQVEPHTHLSGTTGALLILDPPLSMHTTVMFPPPYSGPPAEYREFKTNTVLVWEERSTERSKFFMGLSSDARRNRFYLFSFQAPLYGGRPDDVRRAQEWRNIIPTIEDAVQSLNPRRRRFESSRSASPLPLGRSYPRSITNFVEQPCSGSTDARAIPPGGIPHTVTRRAPLFALRRLSALSHGPAEAAMRFKQGSSA